MMCYIHVLLNALDMVDRWYEAKIVIEGAATKLTPELNKEGNPMNKLFKRAKSLGIIEGVCKACSNKMGVLDRKSSGVAASGGYVRSSFHGRIYA